MRHVNSPTSQTRSQQAIAREALARTRETMRAYAFDKDEVYYAFADKTIVPTFLSEATSRRDADPTWSFRDVHGNELRVFPAFGASMSFMRSRFARDVQLLPIAEAGSGGVHVLPRVGFDDATRLADLDASAPARVGMALGIGDDEAFLRAALERENLALLSLDIAHGANAAALPLLERLRGLGVTDGVVLGNVGSIEGFLFAAHLMQLSGFERPILKAGVGPGSVCTTRINTGVGVGQFTLLEQLARVRADQGLGHVQVIADGGVNTAGDFSKAIALADGVMMGKFFASGSFEDEVLIHDEDGRLTGVHLYGMASAMVTEKRNYIEGSQQTLRSFHRDAGEAVRRLREGLQSAMTYVDARDLRSFRENVRFATNSRAAIVEAGVH